MPARNRYATWQMSDWLAHVRGLGVTSLTGWFRAHPASYGAACALGIQRQVSSALGWRQPHIDHACRTVLGDADIALELRLRAPMQTATDVYNASRRLVAYLKRSGRYESVLAHLGVQSRVDQHVDSLDYFIRRCEPYGSVDAWQRCDAKGVVAARKFRHFRDVKLVFPPASHWRTTGGQRVGSLAELAVGNLLEFNRVTFTSQPRLPFPRGLLSDKSGAPVGRIATADFYIPALGSFVEVWATGTDVIPGWNGYGLRRLRKVQAYRDHRLRVIDLEAAWLQRLGMRGFLESVVRTLGQHGLRLVEPDLSSAVFNSALAVHQRAQRRR